MEKLTTKFHVICLPCEIMDCQVGCGYFYEMCIWC